MNGIKDLTIIATRTYTILRIALAVLAILFPLILSAVGWWLTGRVDASLSDYYYGEHRITRDIFVGVLFAVGFLLFVYQGLSRGEDLTLNLGGIFAVLVALIPTQAMSAPMTVWTHVHIVCAVLLFLCMAVVAIFFSKTTLSLIEDEARRARYRRLYNMLGWLMVVLPISAYVLSLFPQFRDYRIFLIEVFGIWAFGSFWVAKTVELRGTGFDAMAARGELEPVRMPPGEAGPQMGLRKR